MAFSWRTWPDQPGREAARVVRRPWRNRSPASRVAPSSLSRVDTSDAICLCLIASSGKGYLLALNASQIFNTFCLARSPAKNTTKTCFSCFSPVAGSGTAPTGADLRNMLPRVALNSSRSNEDSLSEEIVPATNPSWTDFGSESGTADSSNGAPISRDGSEPESGLVF